MGDIALHFRAVVAYSDAMRPVTKISVLAATVLLTLTLGASIASAQASDDPYVGNTTVQTVPQGPSVAGVSAEQSPEVLGASAERGFLAFTGSDVTVLLVVGGIALASGLALLAVRRRQLPASA